MESTEGEGATFIVQRQRSSDDAFGKGLSLDELHGDEGPGSVAGGSAALSGGLYFVRMDTSEGSFTRTITLVK